MTQLLRFCMAAYAMAPPLITVKNPALNRKPTNMANPRKEPRRDILIRSSFDFISNTNSKTMVAFRPAIFAALMGQNGLNNTIGWFLSV